MPRAYYGPQYVGGVFYCAYWRYEYTVRSLNGDGSITIEITKPGKWANGDVGEVGQVVTHRTGWAYGADRVVSFRPAA